MAAPPQAGPSRAPGGQSAMAMRDTPRILTLKKRPEFLAARKGGRWATPLFVVEAIERRPGQDASGALRARFGFTVSKQVGGAVERNRIKRRLREAVVRVQATRAKPTFDYVLIARRAALEAPFDAILADLAVALERASQPPRPSSRSKSPAKRPPR